MEDYWKCRGVAWIFSGGLSGHFESITRSPQGVRGAKAPRMVAEFHFLKRFKVLENESIFQKISTFFLAKNPFFLRKSEHILQEFLSFFEKLFKEFDLIWPYKSREIPDEF